MTHKRLSDKESPESGIAQFPHCLWLADAAFRHEYIVFGQ